MTHNFLPKIIIYVLFIVQIINDLLQSVINKLFKSGSQFLPSFPQAPAVSETAFVEDRPDSSCVLFGTRHSGICLGFFK